MILTCDRCGKTFERARSIVMRRDRPQKNHYCSQECSKKAQHRMQAIGWLSVAEENDEKFLVNRIVQTAVDMQKHPFGSERWERLDAQHSVLLDVTAEIFRMRGKYRPGHTSEKLW